MWWEREKNRMKELTISKLRMGSLAGFYALGFGVVGFLIGLLYVMADSFQFAAATQAVIKGLAFGVATSWIDVFLVAGGVTVETK
jgi:cell shape-determining protein MreD